MLGTRDGAGGARGRDREEERSHAFWETQPVMQFREDPSAAVRLPHPSPSRSLGDDPPQHCPTSQPLSFRSPMRSLRSDGS